MQVCRDYNRDPIEAMAAKTLTQQPFPRKLRMTSRHQLKIFPASGAKSGADHFRQLDLAIRLGEQQNATVETPVLHQSVFLVARRI